MRSFHRSRSRLFLPSVAALAFVASSTVSTARGGTPPDVLILAAAGASTGAVAYTDPQSRLLATGQFGTVDVMNAGGVTPTLAQLQAYDAVLTWSNLNYLDFVALGNVLADYVDAGGGVVTAVFANSTANANRFLGGRWLTDGYEVIVTQGGNTSGTASLGTLHASGHPILSGVATFAGGTSSYRPTNTALTAGSIRIADWSDGKTLVAEHGTLQNRVDIGFYPLSSAAITGGWSTATDGALLMANALTYSTGGAFTGVPYCFGDGTGTPCPCGNTSTVGLDEGCLHSLGTGGRLAGGGSASVANDTLALLGSGMPNSSALYFQGTSQLNGGAGVVFGDGLRCVGGTITRLGTKSNGAGASQYPSGADPAVSVRGMCAAGDVRTYQIWFRNAAAFCSASTFNLSNGVQVSWLP